MEKGIINEEVCIETNKAPDVIKRKDFETFAEAFTDRYNGVAASSSQEYIVAPSVINDIIGSLINSFTPATTVKKHGMDIPFIEKVDSHVIDKDAEGNITKKTVYMSIPIINNEEIKNDFKDAFINCTNNKASYFEAYGAIREYFDNHPKAKTVKVADIQAFLKRKEATSFVFLSNDSFKEYILDKINESVNINKKTSNKLKASIEAQDINGIIKDEGAFAEYMQNLTKNGDKGVHELIAHIIEVRKNSTILVDRKKPREVKVSKESVNDTEEKKTYAANR